MGFSISWIAFKNFSKAEALERVGLRETCARDEVNQAPFSLAEIPTGWVILFANDFDYGAPEHLRVLSSRAVILSCQVEEHIMFSAAFCCVDGRDAWGVWHHGQQGRYHLSASGTLPREFVPIERRLRAIQDASGGASGGDVDYIFDVPVELSAELTGYRHDRSRFDWGRPSFYALQRRG